MKCFGKFPTWRLSQWRHHMPRAATSPVTLEQEPWHSHLSDNCACGMLHCGPLALCIVCVYTSRTSQRHTATSLFNPLRVMDIGGLPQLLRSRESQKGHPQSWLKFIMISLSLLVNRDSTSIRSRPLPTIYFTLHYTLIFLPGLTRRFLTTSNVL